jgi:hypothetical protein
MPSRSEVYEVIDGERNYQNSLKGRENGKAISDYLIMIDYYLAHAKESWAANPGIKSALHDIRKIAGIAVRCMEEHGAPYR